MQGCFFFHSVQWHKLYSISLMYYLRYNTCNTCRIFLLFRDVDVAGVLVGIILVFIVCHSFKFFVNIYEFYIMHAGKLSKYLIMHGGLTYTCVFIGKDMKESWTNTLDVFVSFSHLLATLNSSINFVIYCYKDEKFRNSFVAMVSTFTHKDQGIIVV